MPIPHAKYTRTLYPYILGSFNYSNPYGLPEGNMPVLSWYQIILFLRRGCYNLDMLRMFSDRVQHSYPFLEVYEHDTYIIYLFL